MLKTLRENGGSDGARTRDLRRDRPTDYPIGSKIVQISRTVVSAAFLTIVGTALPAAADPIPNLNPPKDFYVDKRTGAHIEMEKPDPRFGRSIIETRSEFVMGACSGGDQKDIAPTVERIVRSGKRLRLTWSVASACLIIADNVEARNRKVCVDARPLGIEVVGMMHPSFTVAERNANYRRMQPTVEQFLSGNYDRYWFHREVDPSYLKRDLDRNLPLYRLPVMKQMFRDLPNPGHFSPAWRERHIYTAEMVAIFGKCGG